MSSEYQERFCATTESQCPHFWSEPDEFDRIECLWCGTIRPADFKFADACDENLRASAPLREDHPEGSR